MFGALFAIFTSECVLASTDPNTTGTQAMPPLRNFNYIYHVHDEVRKMSMVGATLCTGSAMTIILTPAIQNKKAAFKKARQQLRENGDCRMVNQFPGLSNIDGAVDIVDDGEVIRLYLVSVYDFFVSADGKKSIATLREEYALCWQTSVDRGCF